MQSARVFDGGKNGVMYGRWSRSRLASEKILRGRVIRYCVLRRTNSMSQAMVMCIADYRDCSDLLCMRFGRKVW